MMGNPPAFTARMVWLVLAILCAASTLSAQSGRGLMHGYVAFADRSYEEVEKDGLTAKIELKASRGDPPAVYETRTDAHGQYDFHSVLPGEYILSISAPGYPTHQTTIYIPSDFECRLAVLLKPQAAKMSERPASPRKK